MNRVNIYTYILRKSLVFFFFFEVLERGFGMPPEVFLVYPCPDKEKRVRLEFWK